ncbi:serine/threonine protein kinase, partial [Actinomadura sp. 7K534]
MPDVTALQPGDPSRLGDYEVSGRLGEGGQGVVYLGRGPGGEQVAIKLLRTRLGRDGKAHQRFVREVAAAERVAPFCTARVITADLHGETPYVVSEYVDGPSLHDRVRDGGPLTGTSLDRLAIVTATALAAVHEAGIVHRDFKPGNVLLAPDGPRVIDFGIARVLDATSTLTSQLVGTPAFMAPEQINGEETGPAGDMFAWAGTIIYAATGRPPFGGDTVAAVMNRIVHHEPDLGALTGPLREVVAAALNKDPAQRPTPRDVIDHMVKG